MKALELHYTSCRRGRSGSAGFQTRTLTPGITPEEQREIERQGIYRPPHDAVEEPSGEEIEHYFPLALRFYTLESGRRALTRSRYTGRDYSGRWGNFFAHTLVFEDGVFEDGTSPFLWPIDYYEWPHWKQGLPPEEDVDEEPPPLTPVDLGGVVPAESFRLEEIREFLGEDPNRPEVLAAIGRAVLLGRESSRAVVIRDTPTNNLYWIASVQKLFPPRHAATLSTSSYQEDPRNCAAVNATAGETGFTFSDTERRYQFYMFDFATGRHSEVPGDGGDYPAIASRWMAEDPSELERFFAFMELFDHRQVEPELLSALRLFELTRQRDRHLEGEDLAAMIRFTTRWATAQGRVELMEVIATAVDRVGGLRQTADYDTVIRFLTDGARGTGEPRHRAHAFATWLRLVDDHVVGRGQGLETAVETWDYLCQIHAVYAGDLAGFVLDPALWRGWQGRLPELSPEILVALVRIVWQSLETVGRLPAWEQPEVGSLVRALAGRPGDLDRLAQGLLEAIPADAEALFAVSRLATGVCENRDPRRNQIAVGRALGRVLAHVSAAVGTAVRRRLDEAEVWDLLIGEWLEIRDTTANAEAAFRKYRREILGSLPGYSRSCGSRVASSLLEHVPEKSQVALALEWLRNREIDEFSDALAGQCLELASRTVSLDLRDREAAEVASLVAAVAEHRRLRLQPDRPLLRQELEHAATARNLADLDLGAVAAALEGVDATLYRDFLSGFLAPALALVDNKSDHWRVLRATFCTRRLVVFEKCYRQFFRTRQKDRWPEALQGALKFWVYLDDPQRGIVGRLEGVALAELVRALGGLSTKRFQKVRKKILPRDPRYVERWCAIETAVAERKQGPFARLRRLFGRALP